MTARCAAVFGVALVAAACGAQPSSDAEFIDLGPHGPVRVRIRATVGGKPVDEVWAAAVEALFVYLDRDRDGLLSPTERVIVTALRDRGIEFFESAVERPVQLTFAKDEKVDRAAFTVALRTTGFGPLSIRTVPPVSDSDKLSAALFKHLDADGDGRLSPLELRNARERLAPWDADEDEILTAAEILGRNAGPAARTIPSPFNSSANPDGTLADAAILPPGGESLAKRFLAAKGGARAASLRPAEFVGPATAFAALDRDGNGKLDAAELTAWLDRPPDLDVAFAFPESDGAVKLVARVSDPDKIREDPDGARLFTSRGIRFRIDATLPAVGKKPGESIRDVLSKGRKSLEGKPYEFALFDQADRNADGTVDAAEAAAVEAMLTPIARCRVTVTISDRGKGLFELLDANDDGRLTPRELANAAAALKPLAGPDGRVGPGDLPRRTSLRAALAGLPLLPTPPVAATPAPAETVPEWFKATDRNGDGDVSRKEFVGPLADFRKLDADGNGLIDAAEARAAGDGPPK